ncbi:hypothetical protein [Bradyrhizobium sp. ORS 86]|uniref:hypothetical protein n=1 Tax=unclassified Bradyrhizobium TaxID=2631580 RepID=UPI00388DF929
MLRFTGFALGIVFVGGLTGSAAQAETVQSMLAAQLRTQGYACDKALGAKKDAKLSKPDDEAWILRCTNATYRIRRAPDLAAKVEVVK